MVQFSEKEHTEEIYDLVENIPNTYNKWLTTIAGFFFIVMLSLSYFIKYPDVVESEVKIVATKPPITLVASASGELSLLIGSYQKKNVNKGNYLAVINNVAITDDVITLKEFMDHINWKSLIRGFELDLPTELILGEIENRYHSFFNAYNENRHFLNYNEFDGKIKFNEDLIKLIHMVIDKKNKIIELGEKSERLQNELYRTDSLLNIGNLIPDIEYISAELRYIESIEKRKNIEVGYINDRREVLRLRYELEDLKRQKNEKNEHLNLDLLVSYNELLTEISKWEQKYVIMAPLGGTLEYLNFLGESQFIQAGEKLFSILPDDNNFHGQVFVPANGAGKVKIGQRVNIKLESFQYQDFGVIEGRVKTISLISNENNYLITVSLPIGLTSNLGKNLFLSNEMLGKAEIITEDKRIWDRLFNKTRSLLMN